MRVVFGALSLLVVVVIVGVLAKRQLTGGAPAAPANPAGVVVPSGSPQQQVQQYRQAVEGAMQHSRPMPDDK